MTDSMIAPETSGNARSYESGGRSTGTGERLALLAFVAATPVAVWLFLARGRNRYFQPDEWGFLAERSLSIRDTFLHHGGHLVALPFLTYRLVFAFFGIRSYTPYLLLSITAHVATCVLVRIVLRRAKVDPWLATATAVTFLFFGAGAQNILWGFQITMIGSLAFGLVHLLLTDHDGPVDHRDWLGLGAGLAGMLCSGVGPTMALVVGVACLTRRGWRIAVLQTLPLGLLYICWNRLTDPLPFDPRRTPIGSLLRWDRQSFTATLGEIGGSALVGTLLAIVLVGGIALGLRREGRREILHSSARLPLVLVLGMLVFTTSTATQRALFAPWSFSQGRYLYVNAVLLLPAIALACHFLLHSRPRHTGILRLMLVGLLLAGIPHNLPLFSNTFPGDQLLIFEKKIVSNLPRLPEAEKAPRDLFPSPFFLSRVKLGWLRDRLASGDLPPRQPVTRRESETFRMMARLSQRPGRVAGPCRPLTNPLVIALPSRRPIEVRGKVGITAFLGRGPTLPIWYGSTSMLPGPQRLEAINGSMRIRIANLDPTQPAVLCGDLRVLRSGQSRSTRIQGRAG